MAVAISKQTDRDITVDFKEQTTIGTPVTGSGAERIRFATSPGFALETNQVPSTESRNDGLSRAAGLGRKQVTGSISGPLSLGSYDTIIAAVMRSTFTADATLDQTDFASNTIGVASGVVTVSGGSFITEGIRLYDVVQPGTGFNAADQSVNCLVTALTATTMTLTRFDGVALTDVAGGVATWSVTVKKHIVQGTTDCAFTIETRRGLIDKSEQIDWARFGTLDFGISPDSEVTLGTSILGRNMTVLGTSSSPGFTSPTEYTSEALQSARAKLIIGTSQVIGLANFSFSLNLNLFRDQTVDELTAEIGVGQPTLTASIEVLEDDLTRVESYLNGTETGAAIIVEEPDATAPKDFISIAMPKVRFGSATASGLGADRFSSRTFPLLIDADLRGGASDATMFKIATSSA